MLKSWLKFKTGEAISQKKESKDAALLSGQVVKLIYNIYVYIHRFMPFSVLIRETFVFFSSLICSVQGLIQTKTAKNKQL